MEKKKDPYMQEAYDMLEQMSADERKRLEYEAREKAIRDYNTLVAPKKDCAVDQVTVPAFSRQYGGFRSAGEYHRLGRGECCQLAVLVETGFCFELSVNEIGQEGPSQKST